MCLIVRFALLLIAVCVAFAEVYSKEGTTVTLSANDILSESRDIPCYRDFDPTNSFPKECHPVSCRRRIVDNVFDEEDINILRGIAEKGMATRENIGGPTILDINTGYIRDSAGLDNLFMKSANVFSSDDFAHYGRIIRKLREEVMKTFGLGNVYFTAPTFITRIDSDHNWSPKEIHDEYWHPHVDRNNTPHYQYSGLLYLSTYQKDFTGGRFVFFPPNNQAYHQDFSSYDDGFPLTSTATETKTPPIDMIVEPRAGRVAIFSSDMENTHQVERVTSGQRFVLSFWFTCDPEREFEIFLDGQAHIQFGARFKESMIRRMKQQQTQKQSKAKKSQEL